MSDTGSSWTRRLAAGWGRAESTVTKLFLFAVFVVGLVAQFVKPVGDALQDKVYLGGALLTVVGYVLYAEVQRLNAGHSEQRRAEAELQAVARRLEGEVQRLNQALRPRGVPPTELEARFKDVLERGGDVRLSVLGFTGETVADPLVTRVLPRLTQGVSRTIRLRVLVPDFTKEIEFPGRVGADGKAGDAPRFRASLVNRIALHEERLKNQTERMERKAQGTLSVEFRVLHMSPWLKLYFINDDVVYEGIYDKVEPNSETRDADVTGQPEPNGSGGHLLDPQGYDSLLTRWAKDDGDEAREIVTRRLELFDTLWDSARAFTTETSGTTPERPEVS
ncbi:ATP/GTP-binding protein [Streptomyces sp. NPDC007808]|uniref:ATP/GTP-binding protein n=1 Tax=Streptomyces sp. NPDC007808 TaxID=3364779 RepID=UPI00369C2D42